MHDAARAGDRPRAAAIDDRLQEVYRTLFITASPAPVKAALNLLGFDVGGVRLPLVEVTDRERSQVQAMLESQSLAASARMAG
jgi:4-hydroxy-tetrahydrodipicolinate synthase